jgi:hypothetical protein
MVGSLRLLCFFRSSDGFEGLDLKFFGQWTLKWFSVFGRSLFGYWIFSDDNTKVRIIRQTPNRGWYGYWIEVGTAACSISATANILARWQIA